MFNEISITNVIEHTAINMWKWWIKNLSFVDCWDLFDWSVIRYVQRPYSAMYEHEDKRKGLGINEYQSIQEKAEIVTMGVR